MRSGERRQKGEGREKRSALLRSSGGAETSQSMTLADMHKNQIHSLKAEYRILQHKQVSHLTHQFGDDKL